MSMALVQVRLPEGLVTEIGGLVDKGYYTNKSDVIRDAIRRLILEKHIGSIQNTGDSVKEIQEIRKKLSSEEFDVDRINEL